MSPLICRSDRTLPRQATTLSTMPSSVERPLVSFVVMAYNLGRFLSDCINSILSQDSFGNFEIVLVNDASTDDTDTVIRSFSDSRIRVIEHHCNQGHVSTANDGFAAARGRFIARIDADDRYQLDFLSKTVPIFF